LEVLAHEDVAGPGVALAGRAHPRATEHPGRGWLMRRLLAAADTLGLTVAYLLALAVRPGTRVPDHVPSAEEALLFGATLPLWIVLARIHGLYDRDEERAGHSSVDDVFGVLQMISIGTWGFLALSELFRFPHPSPGRLAVFWILAVSIVPALRGVVRVFGRRQSAYLQNVIIVGSGPVASLLVEKIAKRPEYRLNVVGYVDGSPGDLRSEPYLGATEELPRLVALHGAHRVVIAFSAESHEQTLEVIRSLQASAVQIDIVPRMFEVLGPGAEIHTMDGIPLVGLPTPRLARSSLLLKRSFDLLGAAAAIVLLLPVFVMVAILIKLDSRGAIFFRQVRMGAGERSFRVFKFRTMYEDAEARKAQLGHLNMHLATDPRMFKVVSDPRVTSVGTVLRRFRIDELPQLLNVLRGEMSLVGPRPLVLDEDRHVERWARRRLDLKPGMTGLWQVLGASDIPFEEMTKLDYLYVTNWSLKEDIRLVLLTVPALLRPHSAY
jgi:exopolysaccharide biosynthesis polyprenyl glycosylphosphotransferase